MFYGDESGGSEVRTYVRALLCKRIAKAECGIRPLCIVCWLAVLFRLCVYLPVAVVQMATHYCSAKLFQMVAYVYARHTW